MRNKVYSQLVDDFVDTYARWREQCISVSEAYQRWGSADSGWADFAYEEYRDALDEEEQAAAEYAEVARNLSKEAHLYAPSLKRVARR